MSIGLAFCSVMHAGKKKILCQPPVFVYLFTSPHLPVLEGLPIRRYCICLARKEFSLKIRRGSLGYRFGQVLRGRDTDLGLVGEGDQRLGPLAQQVDHIVNSLNQ
jgi:hypothetical protein